MKIKTIIKLADVLDDSRRMPCDMNELDTVYYNSISRHEPIKISEMDIVHLIRAFKKQNKKDSGIANEDLLNANKNLSDRNDWLTNRVQEVLNENQQVHLEKQSIRKSMDSYSVQKENEELENVLKDTIKSNSELIQLNKQLKASLRQVNLTPTVSTEAYDIAWKQVDYWRKTAEDNFIHSVKDSEDTEFWKKAYMDYDPKPKGCGYMFSEIPNDTDGQEFVDTMKKYFNKKSYKMRVRGQHIKPELRGTGATAYGQNIEESTHMRVYIDIK